MCGLRTCRSDLRPCMTEGKEVAEVGLANTAARMNDQKQMICK
jgi:hypothetical protein